MSLPGIGKKGQEKLHSASVLVVGAGGLGCPALLYLVAAGIGKVGIVDGDRIQEENLHRQVLYSETDVGEYKTEVAARKLNSLNPEPEVVSYTDWLTRQNAMQIINDYDIVLDGTDNFPARYLINDACVFLDKPFVYGSIYRFEGQLAVFNWQKGEERGPDYRDLFPEPPPAALVPDCSEAGVLGTLPGIIGAMQATEIIKAITEMEGLLNGRLLLFDALQNETRITTIKKRKDNPVSGENPTITKLMDYERFCSPVTNHKNREISAEELKSWLDASEKVQLIDVRKKEEHDAFHIHNSTLMPLDEIEKHAAGIDKSIKVVLYCQSGKRSAEALHLLSGDGDPENVYHLAGGVEAWKKISD